MQKLELALDDLFLDLKNPRTPGITSQADAVAAIIKLSPSNFRSMMKSIKEHGLDPGDLFYVIDDESDPGEYIVVDGNRRLCALKVLHEPALLAGAGVPEAIARLIRKEAADFDKKSAASRFEVVLFDNREEADEWILRRHGRGQEGEGRIAWSPLEIQRFMNDRSILDVIDFVERNSTMPDADWAATKSAVIRKSSVLRRMLESKSGRKWLGLTIERTDEETVPSFGQDPSRVLKILEQIMADIRTGGIDTRSYNKTEEIDDYFTSLPQDLAPTSDTKPTRFRDSTLKSTAVPTAVEQPKASEKGKTTRPASLRPTLAPAAHSFKQPVNAKGQEFVREASKVRLREMPLASAFIFRGFIQYTIDTYMHENGIDFWENNKQLELSVRAERVFDHLIKNKKAVAMDVRAIRRRLSEKATANPSSIQALNDVHHDRYQVPEVDSLRAAWDDAVALFVAVYGAA